MAYPSIVQLTNTLPAVVLAGNKVPLKFQASLNFLSSAGTKSSITLTWTAADTDGLYFDLLLFGVTVRFTCKASPDNSGTQYHTNAGSLPLASWVAIVKADLGKNYLIARYYDLILNDVNITITAKEVGSAYSQDYTGGSGVHIHEMETNKVGTDLIRTARYYIVVLLYCNNAYVTEILLNVDANGLTEVDISKYLQAFLVNSFTWPSGVTRFFDKSGAVVPFYFKYGERWGDDDYQALQISDTYYAIDAGLSKRQLALYNKTATDFWTKLVAGKLFLTWAPLTRIIGKNEAVKLYYLNYSGATSIQVYIKKYVGDTNSTGNATAAHNISDKAIVEIDISDIIQGWSEFTLQTLIKFDIWLVNQSGTVISEVRTFEIDYSDYAFTRNFIFKNSLGCYEILRTTGMGQKFQDIERNSSEIIPADTFTDKDREELSDLNVERQRFTVSAGWLTRYGSDEEYRNWLRDFALSKEVFEIKGNNLVPVRIISTSFEDAKDGDNFRKFSFDYVNAFTDEFFTREITPDMADNSDFNQAQ